jgi:nitrate/nitrite-specific signal transduction histidine kinase
MIGKRDSQFQLSNRLSSRLSLIIAGCVAAFLAVGGFSVVLSLNIARLHRIVDEERLHIDVADDISSAFHQLIFEIQHTQLAGKTPAQDLLVLHGQLTSRLNTFRGFHAEEEGVPEDRQIRTAFAWFAENVESLRPMILALSSANAFPSPLEAEAIERLGSIAHQLPVHLQELSDPHEVRITKLLDAGRRLERIIIFLYFAMIGIGSLLVLIAWWKFHQEIAAPIQSLAVAAGGVAEGRLEVHVPIGRPDEIGQLSQAFNTMAERLQARDRELREAQDLLERKIQEIQALYKIATEILALHDLDSILRLVADNARRLLDVESSAVCLLTPARDGLAVRCTSGSDELFQVREGAVCPAADCLAGQGRCFAECLVLRADQVRSHHAVPLRRGSESVGVLCVASRREHAFGVEEVELLLGLASQTAVAIENARLIDEVGKLAVAEERGRIARDLHDGLAQTVSLLHLRIRQAQATISSEQRERFGSALEEMAAITASAYDEIRQSLFGLRTMVSGGLGLIPSLTEFLHEFSVQNEIPVKLEANDAETIRLSPGPEFQLIRIVQEALSNIRKHAQATRAWVRVSGEDGWVRVSVEDDGRGFDPATLATPSRLHFGLRGMQERAEGLGGKLEIVTVPGHGTRVTAILPLESPS